MRKLLIPFLLAAAAYAPPEPLTAQVTRADTAQVMYRVAQDLMSRGRTDDAEQLLAIIQRRYADTEFGTLAANVLEGSVSDRQAQSGRTELVAWSTIYGASLGFLIPAALGANDAEPYGLGLLLGGPVGFGVSSSWATHHPVSSGQARAMTFGSWWGTWQALGWQQVLNLGDEERTDCFDTGNGQECFTFHDESEQAPFTAMVLGGLTGLAVGTAIGQARPISSSSALITNFSAMWGTWFGTVLGVLTDRDNFNSFGGTDDHHVLTYSLVGGNLGLLAGAFGAPALGWTTGQAWTVHLAGVAGIVAGFGLDLLMSIEDERGILALPAITSGLALAVAGVSVRPGNSRGSSGGALQMSMVDIADGDISLGIPAPMPTLTPVWSGAGRRLAPGARISLLRVGM